MPQSQPSFARGFWARHYQWLAPIFAIAAAAVAIGPDSWMEYLLAGITVIPHPTIRLILVIVAALLVAGLAWPLLRPSRHEER